MCCTWHATTWPCLAEGLRCSSTGGGIHQACRRHCRLCCCLGCQRGRTCTCQYAAGCQQCSPQQMGTAEVQGWLCLIIGGNGSIGGVAAAAVRLTGRSHAAYNVRTAVDRCNTGLPGRQALHKRRSHFRRALQATTLRTPPSDRKYKASRDCWLGLFSTHWMLQVPGHRAVCRRIGGGFPLWA